MKRVAKRLGLLVVAAVLVAGWVVHFHTAMIAGHLPKWGWLQAGLTKMGEAPPPPEPDEDPDNTKNAIPVHAGEVTVATLHRYIEGYGVAMPRPAHGKEPAASATISATAAGIVMEVQKQPGEHVKRGDVILRLDDRVARSAEQAAEAGLTQAKASLAALKATPRPEQLSIANLAVEKARAALAFSRKGYDRAEKLAAGQATSEKTLQQAQNDLAAAKNDLAMAEGQLAVLKATPTLEDLAQENAKVAQAEAALASARVQRAVLSVASPIDGIVGQVAANPGEAVDPTKPLVQVVDPERLCISVSVPSSDVPANAVGLTAEILRAGQEAASAKVSFVSPQVDAKTGAVTVVADLVAGSGIRPGETVRIRIVAEERKGLAVPRAAVVADENGDPVICVLEGEQATHKSVKVGIEENGLVEVSADGLAEGKKVVTEGAYGLPQATRVKVIP